ncbi:hypothetical protein Q8W17_02070 [Photobacterium damselae subsp. piscicida]|nr:hypothetical protein [Photobacterium damselae subsp. piscicida]
MKKNESILERDEITRREKGWEEPIKERGNFRCPLRSYLQHSRYYGAPCIIPLTAVIRQQLSFILRPEVVPMVILNPSPLPAMTLILRPGGVPCFILKAFLYASILEVFPDFFLKLSFVFLTSKHPIYCYYIL